MIKKALKNAIIDVLFDKDNIIMISFYGKIFVLGEQMMKKSYEKAVLDVVLMNYDVVIMSNAMSKFDNIGEDPFI